MVDKVVLTIGRHGRYGYGTRFPLLEGSIVEGVYRGMCLCEMYGCPDVIYSSTIARAAVTANLHALGCGYDSGIIFDDNLLENAGRQNVAFFIDMLAAEAQSNGYKHIHIVTHAPVIEKLTSLISNSRYFVQPDGGIIWEADCWDELLTRRGRISLTEGLYPGLDLLVNLWRSTPDEQRIKSYFSREVNVDWDKVIPLLALSGQFSSCSQIEKVYDLLAPFVRRAA